MPVTLTEGAIRDALAVLEEREPEAAQAATAALEWMGWEREGDVYLRRYDVQLLVWYQLPTKFLASLDEKRAVAAALAGLLDRLGERAASYAAFCRSPETDALLEAWEREDPDARRRLLRLLNASGLEPADTDLLEWGTVMGSAEAQVREHVTIALEEALEEGLLAPGARGFRRRQSEVVDAALREPWDDGGALTRLQAIHGERIDRWLERGDTRGGERRALLMGVAELVAEEPVVDPASAAAVREALGPALWLLERARDGIGLTQTGALNRAFVRETAERFPAWWDPEPYGLPKREDEFVLLRELHDLQRHSRLLRRDGKRIVATKRGNVLALDPWALLTTLSAALFDDETSFDTACAELATALILTGADIDAHALAATIGPTIAADGWNAGGLPPSERDIAFRIRGFTYAAEALGLVERVYDQPSRWSFRLVLTPAGRAGLTAGLRARAIGPSSRY